MSDNADEAGVGHNSFGLTNTSAEKLFQTVERIERLEEEKKEIADQIKEVYAEAKAFGFDTKVLRQVIARRRKDQAALEEQEQILDVYELAIKKIVDQLV